MNTDRVYDISGWVVLMTVLAAVVAWAVALLSPFWAIDSHDINGAWAVVALATLMCGIVSYGWAFGHKLCKPLH